MAKFDALPPTSAVVGQTSAPIVSANDTRRGLVVINTSVNNIFVAFGTNAAELNKGIVLYPRGSLWLDAHMFVTSAVNAIATAPGSLVTIQEF